jgi:hypothetical protein
MDLFLVIEGMDKVSSRRTRVHALPTTALQVTRLQLRELTVTALLTDELVDILGAFFGKRGELVMSNKSRFRRGGRSSQSRSCAPLAADRAHEITFFGRRECRPARSQIVGVTHYLRFGNTRYSGYIWAIFGVVIVGITQHLGLARVAGVAIWLTCVP